MTPAELEARRNSATRPRRTVPVILDGEIRQRVQELLAERETLAGQPAEAGDDRRLTDRPSKRRTAPPPRLSQIDDELDALYSAVESATLHVVVEGLGGTAWDAFKAAHQPQREGNQADRLWGFNTEAGRAPLIRATIVGHRDGETLQPLDDDTRAWLIDTFATDWQLDLLFLAALTSSRGDDAVPLRPALSTIPTSDAE